MGVLVEKVWYTGGAIVMSDMETILLPIQVSDSIDIIY